MEKKWYAVYTKLGSEKKVSEAFTRKKLESFTPFVKYRSKGNNKKFNDTLLFNGYVFVKATELQGEEIKKISDVINLVYWMGNPVVIKNSEIKAIKFFLNEYENVALEKIFIKNNSVNIRGNSDIELEAPMLTIRNKKARVELPSLGYMLVAEVEAPNVRIISVESSLNTADSKLNKLLNRVSKFDNSLRSF